MCEIRRGGSNVRHVIVWIIVTMAADVEGRDRTWPPGFPVKRAPVRPELLETAIHLTPTTTISIIEVTTRAVESSSTMASSTRAIGETSFTRTSTTTSTTTTTELECAEGSDTEEEREVNMIDGAAALTTSVANEGYIPPWGQLTVSSESLRTLMATTARWRERSAGRRGTRYEPVELGTMSSSVGQIHGFGSSETMPVGELVNQCSMGFCHWQGIFESG